MIGCLEGGNTPAQVMEIPLQTPECVDSLVSISLFDVVGSYSPVSDLPYDKMTGVFKLDYQTARHMALNGKRLAGIRIRGDAMAPILLDGDWVIIDCDDQNYARAGVFLIWANGEFVLKRVQRMTGGKVYLISDNSMYQAEMFGVEEVSKIEVVGRVRMRL